MLFSATVPKWVKKLVKQYLNDPVVSWLACFPEPRCAAQQRCMLGHGVLCYGSACRAAPCRAGFPLPGQENPCQLSCMRAANCPPPATRLGARLPAWLLTLFPPCFPATEH